MSMSLLSIKHEYFSPPVGKLGLTSFHGLWLWQGLQDLGCHLVGADPIWD